MTLNSNKLSATHIREADSKGETTKEEFKYNHRETLMLNIGR